MESQSSTMLQNDEEIYQLIKQRDDFFYKISQKDGAQSNTFEIRVVSTNKKYIATSDPKAEVGFLGLPFEFERQLRSLELSIDEICCTPFEILMMVNFLITEGFAKMQNKKTLYQKMSAICDQIIKQDPFKYFTKIATIGNGGFGTVILVEHKKSRKHFAMKIIKPEDESDLEDTLTEIALQNMVSLQHKNIIRIFHSFEVKETFYLIMEWMDGGDLSTMIKTIPGQIPENVIAYIGKQILLAIHEMHQNNQIHRDLKPLNVMLTTQGDIKIGDFGLAAQLVQESYNSKEIKGTPKWMAPEILLTKPYNTLVDVWSLGIMLLELATGDNPYRGLPLNRIMFAMKNEKPPKIRNAQHKWSEDFMDFVNNRCLVKNPVNRADTFELLAHPFVKNADDEDHKDAFLFFQADYYNSSKIKIKANKIDIAT